MTCPAGGDAVVHGEVDVDGATGRIRVGQRVAALVHLGTVGEPAADPHRRVHRAGAQQRTGVEMQSQVVRGELGATGHRECVVVAAAQAHERPGQPA